MWNRPHCMAKRPCNLFHASGVLLIPGGPDWSGWVCETDWDLRDRVLAARGAWMQAASWGVISFFTLSRSMGNIFCTKASSCCLKSRAGYLASTCRSIGLVAPQQRDSEHGLWLTIAKFRHDCQFWDPTILWGIFLKMNACNCSCSSYTTHSKPASLVCVTACT